MNSVAIITARGGSKRIPRKNIKLFRGKPIIAYSIEAALACSLFDLVIVSTDDEEIAEVSEKWGAKVPFLRSAANSDDFATTSSVALEVIDGLQKNGQSFQYACCIYPTAPFVTDKNLLAGFDLLIKKKYSTVFPVCAFSHPIYRALKINELHQAEMIWPENLNKRSQDLSPAYHDAGQFYWIQVSSFLEEKKLFTSNSGSIILDEMQVQDIDNETDWKIAELKHAILFPL